MQASSQQQQKQSVVQKQASKPIAKSKPDTPSLPRCPKCNTEIPEDADFCGECGEPITEKAMAQTQAEAIEAEEKLDVVEEEPTVAEEEPEVIEEEPVRKSLFSGGQIESIMQTGAAIDEAKQRRAEEARIAAATSAQARQQTAPAPAEPFDLIGTIWTWIPSGGERMDVHFMEHGVLECPDMCDGTWVQNGNSVTIEFESEDDILTIELKIINAKLMQGKTLFIEDDDPSELRRK